MSQIVEGCCKVSQNVPIVANCRELSQIVANCREILTVLFDCLILQTTSSPRVQLAPLPDYSQTFWMIRLFSSEETSRTLWHPAQHHSAHPRQLAPEKWIGCASVAQKMFSGCMWLGSLFFRAPHIMEYSSIIEKWLCDNLRTQPLLCQPFLISRKHPSCDAILFAQKNPRKEVRFCQIT